MSAAATATAAADCSRLRAPQQPPMLAIQAINAGGENHSSQHLALVDRSNMAGSTSSVPFSTRTVSSSSCGAGKHVKRCETSVRASTATACRAQL